jgi:hypothetical protein
MEGMEMTNHCETKTPASFAADDQFSPLVAGVGRAASEDGSVVRYRLEAAEIDWEIAPGRKVRGYGFNGQVPGPVLKAKQGVPLEIEFTNRLPEPTVIHWHGLRIPAAMDGTENVQRPIQPGETFTYRFTPPDAGTFWYHPHLNETEQLEKGLYGALIVRAADELTLDDEKILVFDDLRADKSGQIAKFGGLMDRHNGREGNVRLINGTSEPELTIAAGQIERWRIVNASSARSSTSVTVTGASINPPSVIRPAIPRRPPVPDRWQIASSWRLDPSRNNARFSTSRTCRTTAWPGRKASNGSVPSASRHDSRPPQTCRAGCARSRRSSPERRP